MIEKSQESEIARKVRLLMDETEKISKEERDKMVANLTDEERKAMTEEYESRRYQGRLNHWDGGSIQYFRCHTLDEAIEEGKKILSNGDYGPLYSSVPIVECLEDDGEKIVAVVEKQPKTWDTVVLKGAKEIYKKSIYPWGLYTSREDFKTEEKEAQEQGEK